MWACASKFNPAQFNQRFQVKLSVPLKNAEGYHIGALSIGIDVERALATE